MASLTGRIDDAIEWLPVEEVSAAGNVRRVATTLAQRLDFSEHRVGEVAIAATELSTNLARHAKQGTIGLRIRRDRRAPAVELIVIDSGPGMADFGERMRDGRSSAGTLGIGLGAIFRMATAFDADSRLGAGTVIVVTFTEEGARLGDETASGITRSMNGEHACGDAWAKVEETDFTTVMLADGLGHGELAALASDAAVAAFMQSTAQAAPSETLARLDVALRGTRGAAVAIVRIDRSARSGVFCGVGNIAGWVVDDQRRRGLASRPGIVGAGNAGKPRDFAFEFEEHSAVILHSDGLTSKWSLDDYPGIRTHGPVLIGATILRNAGIRHDDASIVVVKSDP